MLPRAYVPQALARQPWQVIVPLTALALFGGAVLYSAAGGRLSPWAASHVTRYFGFLVMAMLLAKCSPTPPLPICKVPALTVVGPV